MAQDKDKKIAKKGDRIITINISEKDYARFISESKYAKDRINEAYLQYPELFPKSLSEHYVLNGLSNPSKKMNYQCRMIKTGGIAYRIYPHFLLPYMRGKVEDVSSALFLSRWVPFWVLAEVFGRDPMYWHRLVCSISSKNIVGTTIQRDTEIPKDLAADEHHSKQKGKKVYIATTVAKDCFLGAEVTKTCDEKGLTKAYGVFKDESKRLSGNYIPESVNLDGWKAGEKSWKSLFPAISIIFCFLHAYIKVRDRALKKMEKAFLEVADKIWECYKAKDKRSFSQRLRRLKSWCEANTPDSIMKTNVLKLCNKSKLWQRYYDHPNSHRTSNMLDRLMRFMDRFMEKNQTFHGNIKSSNQTIRSFALIYNFTPSCPDKNRDSKFKSPVARLNNFQYHENWLSNLLIAGSLNGKRT